MRLIDADRLLEELKKTDRYFMVKFDIENAPTVERPHGEWKPDGTCSECGVYSSLNKNTVYFCPNCGADMRKERGCEE